VICLPLVRTRKGLLSVFSEEDNLFFGPPGSWAIEELTIQIKDVITASLRITGYIIEYQIQVRKIFL